MAVHRLAQRNAAYRCLKNGSLKCAPYCNLVKDFALELYIIWFILSWFDENTQLDFVRPKRSRYPNGCQKMALETVGGFDVEMCASGEEAIQKAPNFRSYLVLLDVMTPGMDGVATYRVVRELPEVIDTHIIFMTVKSQAHEVEQLLELGALGVIS